jgi:splicing factor 3B subunit 3
VYSQAWVFIHRIRVRESVRPARRYIPLFPNDCDRHIYQFQKLGEDGDETEFKSTSYPSFGMADPSIPLPHAYFRPRALENLKLVDELESLDPIIDSKVLNLLPNADAPQIFAACGRGARSTLRTLRHGLEVEELTRSDVPLVPNGLWTTKRVKNGTICLMPPF